MAEMDLLTLLNTAASTSGKASSREATPSSTHEDLATPPSTAVPTPSPEPSWSGPRMAEKHAVCAQSWESEETNSTPQLEAGSGWVANFSFPSKGEHTGYVGIGMDHLESDSSNSAGRRLQQIVTDSTSPRTSNNPSSEDASAHQAADPFRTSDYRGHRYSDSHSSLGSLATSRSEAHSRISSVTTINEIPSIDAVLSEVSRADASSPGCPGGSPIQAERRNHHKSQDSSLSPRIRGRSGFIVPRITRPASPSDVALHMKQSAAGQPPDSATIRTPSLLRNTGRLPGPRTHKRAVSAPVFPPLPRRLPSFTINQTRPLLPPPRHMMAGSTSTMPDEDSVYYRRSPSEVIQEHYQTRPMITARHSDSETATATPTTGSRITSPTVLSQVSEVAQHRAHTESIYEIDDENLRMPSLEELKLHGMQEEKVECIFVDGCATNSPVRKSVSHFFGRNKGTTLQIPEHIWLVYCRQHYQRLRYRLGQNYALHQLDLVKVVIHRIERWGKENKAKNDGDEVLDWQIMLRKCVRDEQERWTRFKQDLRRQGLPQHEQDEKYETFKASRVGPSKYQRALGRGDDAGPDAGLADTSTNNAAETLHSIEKNYPWLLDTLGDHKSADEVINVINRLRHDYKEAKDAKTPGGVSVIKELPPIEFLPNLSNDNEDRPVKAGRKRGPARAARATEAAKRRATRFGESPNNAVDAGHYSHSEFDPRMTPSQMGYWPNRTGVQHVQERDTSKPSYIVPHMQPLNYGYRSTTGPSSDVVNRDVLPPATSQPALGRSDPTRQLLPTPRPSHHRSASAFTLGTRFTPISERPSSSGEGAAPGRAYDQGDYFTSPAPIPGNRNAYVFGDPNGYQTGPQNRPAPFDFAPRSRPGAWSDSEHQEVPRVATWPSHDSIASVAVGWRPDERIQRGDERQ